MSHYRDILWVEDFDTQDESVDEEETETKRYYDSGKRKYSFRVSLQREVLPLLKHLEDEKNFSSYSCAVLDINLTEGFGCDPNESEVTELSDIKKILMENQIKIRSEHEKDNDKFKKNSGYYVYLYLVNRGMPPSRICMLTGNQGEGNLTDNWKTVFESAGIMPPKDFAKYEAGIKMKDFHDWLEETLTPVFRLRACIIGMSFYAKKLLEDETLKVHVQNLYRIPLRLSEDKETASPEFISALWQILQIWESHEDTVRAYQMTLKTARNWFAHRCLKKVSLLTAAFLFGIGMRGLLGEKIRRNLDDIFEDTDWKKRLSSLKINKENIEGYKLWEDELLSLIEELDKEKSSDIKTEINEQFIIKSCQEFFTRIKNAINNEKSKGLKIYFTSDICNLIQETIGQKIINKKENNINRYEEDLLRDFMHGVYPLNWNYNRLTCKLEISLRFDSNIFESLKNSKEAKYLNAVKNTLTLAINR